MIKQSMVLRFKRVKNEAKMVVIFKRVKIEVINGFKIQRIQEWSYNWFSRSNGVKNEVKMQFSCTNEYRMNLEGTLKFKRVRNKAISGFKI